MTLSHGSAASSRAEHPFDDGRFSNAEPARFVPRERPRATRGRKLVAIWAVLSIGWAAAVAVELCDRARIQADLTGDVDHDLDQIACVGPNCLGDNELGPDRSWPMIVATYLQWDMAGILEWAAGPPLAILILGAGTVLILRRRAIGRADSRI